MCLNEYTQQKYIISDYYSFIDMNDSAKKKEKIPSCKYDIMMTKKKNQNNPSNIIKDCLIELN